VSRVWGWPYREASVRQSSAIGSSACCERWPLNERKAGFDYVLAARPGLVEAVESHGFDWLGERVDEVMGKAGS